MFGVKIRNLYGSGKGGGPDKIHHLENGPLEKIIQGRVLVHRQVYSGGVSTGGSLRQYKMNSKILPYGV